MAVLFKKMAWFWMGIHYLNQPWPSFKMVEAEWRIYASVNYATIGSDNGFSPVQRQAII